MYELDDDHLEFQGLVRRFVAEEVLPVIDEYEQERTYPHTILKQLGELGYLGLRYPEDQGGSGGTSLQYVLFCEELARGWMSLAAAAAMQSLMGTHFIFHFGNDDHRKRLFSGAISGELVAGIAMTEPDAGSDLGAMSTKAERTDEGWVLNGRKTWISNAHGDVLTVAATTHPGTGLAGVNFFLMEKGTPGYRIGKPIPKLATRCFPAHEVSFEDCILPEENMLGKSGEGKDQILTALAEIRIMTAALGTGLAEAALEKALRYTKEREQFGKPINRFQAVSMQLGKVATDLHHAKLGVYHAARMLDRGEKDLEVASMTKLFATEVAANAVDVATRVYGANGIADEYEIERLYRDARFLLYGGGTSEVLTTNIARQASKRLTR